jgi:hypothetical protein
MNRESETTDDYLEEVTEGQPRQYFEYLVSGPTIQHRNSLCVIRNKNMHFFPLNLFQ